MSNVDIKIQKKKKKKKKKRKKKKKGSKVRKEERLKKIPKQARMGLSDNYLFWLPNDHLINCHIDLS